ncbi:MAG: 3-hydroxy-3-methylglutaryl-CoA reductase, hydroxymethylglutaryl-CoA reductase (NADPH) [Candidatus Gottesmanbacteria bacterium GW2011_GWA2_43_14]|uniref:hydroxymethylglutaryl-CoA reductase (NADPH) n=1 Tax=Candidatus Gottesmanbacteria bacterium GW2011_GWA2_43_14 TaxID=1618443 RepID=A0A0G1DJP4_9BACT|nr:MAG: 3-hydroxy-3-methylglutaryl-CoA reductase, hydroxymethylglutaryl-CoA reductase (NADPH) [Candidatus Gottesmanbacteria bacterium GW2011_GWA2_43_14]
MLRKIKTIEKRRQYLEKKTGLSLVDYAFYPPGFSQAEEKNCENMVGAVQVPIGIAGPLKIIRDNGMSEYYLPLATTEGALVASVNRGCKAITRAGGVRVTSENTGITRGSLFITGGIIESRKLKEWLGKNFTKMQAVAEQTSGHLRLNGTFIKYFGTNVYIRFSYDTEDAMGMNMVTFATEAIIRMVENDTGFKCLAVAANFDTDKKPSFLNFLLGRGREVWAETLLDKQTVRHILKTTPELIHEVNLEKNLKGSMISASLGFNAHFANIIAAIFLATGQDIAHVSEGSLGITSTKFVNGKLLVSIYLPDLPVGTIGGGTYLPSQKASLLLLGSAGGDSGKRAQQFAEIIGGAVLAGEISLLSAIAAGSLGKAHRLLARGGK